MSQMWHFGPLKITFVGRRNKINMLQYIGTILRKPYTKQKENSYEKLLNENSTQTDTRQFGIRKALLPFSWCS